MYSCPRITIISFRGYVINIGVSKYIPLRGYLNEIADRQRREKQKEEELKKQQLIRQERISAEEELKRMQEQLKKQDKKKIKKGNDEFRS